MAKKENKQTSADDKAAIEATKIYLKAQEELKKSTKSLEKDIDSISDSYKDMADVLRNVVDNAKLFGSRFSDIEDISKKLIDNLENIGSELYEQIDFSEQIQAIAEKEKKLGEERLNLSHDATQARIEELALSREINKKEQELVDLMNSGNEALMDQTKTEIQRLNLQRQKTSEFKDEIKLMMSENKLATENLITQKSIVDQLNTQNKVLDSANAKAKELGISVKDIADELVTPFEEATQFLDKLPGGKILSKAFGLDTLAEKAKKSISDSFTTSLAQAANGGKITFKSLSAGARTFGAAVKSSLGPLLLVFAAVEAISAALEMDQEVTDMARGLALSKDEAQEIHGELIEIAENTKVVGANASAMGAAYQDLAKSMGVTKLASAEMAETQVYLNKQLGMSSESATAFQKMSMAGGKTAYQNLAVIQKGVESMTGGLMNYKEVANDIATSSKAVQASYKGNIAALTKAVVTAKKFGMTLDDTKKAADSILDIESSLEKEMTANVLTGKNMNLNRARELSLMGDTAGAMDEMMKQAGGYDELMDMAPYKQKAVAEAMGMTTEEMIKAAEHQKNMQSIAEDVGVALGKNGEYTQEQLDAAAAMGNEEAKKLAMQNQVTSAQEKMAAMGDKLMVMFQKMAEPIMEMLDPLMSAVDFLFPAIKAALNFAFAPIIGIMDMFKGVGKILDGDILGGLSDIGEGIMRFFFAPFMAVWDLLVGFFPSIGKLFDDAIGWVKDSVKGLLPDWAIKLLGMDEGASAESGAASSAESPIAVEDALIRPGQPPVTFDKGDLIMAGTNLLGDSSASAPVSQNSGNSEMISLLKELIAKVDQPVKITIGSKAIDEIESQTSMKRSFTTKADRSYGTFS